MPLGSDNIRRQRFEKIASKRVQKLLDDMDLLANCSNKNNYEYSQADVKKMMAAIRLRLRRLEAAFLGEKGRDADLFRF